MNALHNLNLGLQHKQPFFELMEQYVKTRDFVESDNRHESDEKMKVRSRTCDFVFSLVTNVFSFEITTQLLTVRLCIR